MILIQSIELLFLLKQVNALECVDQVNTLEWVDQVHALECVDQVHAMVNILAKSDPPPRGGGFNSGVPKKNKGQIKIVLSALLARSAKVLIYQKMYTFLLFRMMKLPF